MKRHPARAIAAGGRIDPKLGRASVPKRAGQMKIRIGRYETVALPLFNLAEVAATMEPGLDRSTLSVDRFHVYERGDRMRVAFHIADQRDERRKTVRLSAEIAAVDEVTWPDRTEERLIAVQAHIVLGHRLSRCNLYLTTRRLRSTALVLGKSFIGDNVFVDVGSAFTVGCPHHPLIGMAAD